MSVPAISELSAPPYDTKDEVTWFISVTKEPTWSQERFEHEYREIHAGMVKKTAEMTPFLLGYTQLAVADTTGAERLHPGWDYVTCLTWKSTFVVWAGFQDKKYRETAGKHIFCRLDQVGSIAKKIHGFSLDSRVSLAAAPVRALIFHRRSSDTEEASDEWLQGRLQKAKSFSSQNERLCGYSIWKDVTPKDTSTFFHDTQFSGGSWLQFKAVEAYEFNSRETSLQFFDEHRREITDDVPSLSLPIIVIGTPFLVV